MQAQDSAVVNGRYNKYGDTLLPHIYANDALQEDIRLALVCGAGAYAVDLSGRTPLQRLEDLYDVPV